MQHFLNAAPANPRLGYNNACYMLQCRIHTSASQSS